MVDDIRPYLEIRRAGPAGLSPDASKVLISSDLTGTAQLYRLPRTGGELVQLTDFADPVGGSYLPHTDRILLVRDRGGDEEYQLYLMDDEGQGVTDLVVEPGVIHRPGGVSRDGRLMAYASNRRTGVDFDVHVRPLGDGGAAAATGQTGQRQAGPGGAAGERTVYAPGGWAGGAGFSPDASTLAVYRLTERSGDNQVHLLDLDGGGSVELAPHPGQEAAVGDPSWLPGGQALYFATNVGREFTGIARSDPAGRWSYVVEPGWDAGCAVDRAGRHLLVAWNAGGFTRACLHDPQTLEVTGTVPLPGQGVAGGFAFSADGRWLTFSFSSAEVPGDAWLYDIEAGGLTRLTTSPCPVAPAGFVAPTTAEAVAADGERIPLFVYRPTAATAATPRGGVAGQRWPGAGGRPRRDTERGPRRRADRHPVVVVLHGGPESQYRPSFSPLTQYLVANGFAVVAPNIRGSTGYGRRFEHLDDVGGRLDAVADLEAVHDWIAASDDLDPDRAALYGGSYGGYLVLAGLAFQPDRWAAGVDIVGISSLVTFLENTSAWRRAVREREYGSLDHDRDLLEAASPINHVDRMRAPLFIVHGRNDPRVPLSEAEQIHRVLDGRGVRTELAVYDDEGHGLKRLANRLDAYPRIAAFLHEVLEG